MAAAAADSTTGMVMARRRGRTLAIAVALSMLWTAAANAQSQEEPVVIGGKQEQPPRFYIQRPSAVLALLGHYTSEKNDTPAEHSQTTETHFEETLTLSTIGYAFSPGFMLYNLSGTFGLQQTQMGGDINDSSNGTLYEYAASVEMMNGTRHPVRAFASRDIQLIDQSFAPSVQSTTELEGISGSYRTRDLLNTVQFMRSVQTETSLLGQEDFTTEQDTFEWQGSAKIGAYQSFDWFYNYTSAQASGRDAASAGNSTQTAQMNHSIAFGKNHQDNLRSSLYYTTMSGTVDTQSLRLDEQLNVRHSPTLTSFYNYNLSQAEFDTQSTTSQQGRAGFRHRLYQSLVTTGTVGASQSDTDNVGLSRQDANLTLDYTKKVPWGRLDANLSAAYNLEQNDARSTPLHVFDTPLFMSGFLPATLTGQRIVPNSLHITDTRNLRLYQEGRDYSVLALPDRLQIRRLPGSTIPDNSTILVDYDVAAQGASDTATTSLSLGAHYSFLEGPLRGFTPYVQYSIVEQSISTSDPTIVPDNVRDLLYGATYSIWKLTFSAEQEFHESNLSPYDSIRVSARYADMWLEDLTFNAGVAYNVTNYSGSAIYTGINDVTRTGSGTAETLLIDAGLDYQISNRWHLTGSANYLDETVLGVKTTGFEQYLELRWEYRQTSVFANVRHSTLDTDEQKQDFLLIQFGIQRRF